MKFAKRTFGSHTFGIIPFIVTLPLLAGLLIGSIFLGTWIGIILFTSLLLLFFASLRNKIFLTEASVSEKKLFGKTSIPLEDIRQIGLLVVQSREHRFLKEENIRSTAKHIEIYLLSYETVDIPSITDTGKRILFDYRENVWNLLKNNLSLQVALKQGELVASKSKQFL